MHQIFIAVRKEELKFNTKSFGFSQTEAFWIELILVLTELRPQGLRGQRILALAQWKALFMF